MMKNLRRRLTKSCIALATAGFAAGPAAANDAGFDTRDGTTREIGDVLQYVLPVTAIATPTFLGDWAGLHEYSWALVGTAATAGLGKAVYSKMRPNQSTNGQSFPSGHTAAAFSGASFIDARYGHTYGWLAYAAAGYVGYSRVWADAHFVDDVVAGASIGTLWSLYFTSPYASEGGVALLPMEVNDGYGLVFHVRGKSPEVLAAAESPDGKIDWFRPPSRAIRSKDPRHTFTYGFGPAFLSKQEIRSPSSSGTTFDLYNFNRDDDPTTTAAVSLDLDLKGKHSLMLAFWPFESRDQGKFNSPVSFAGQVFPANTNIRSAWLMYDIRAVWNYNILDGEKTGSKWDVDLGLGATVQYLDIILETTQGPTISSQVDDTAFLPLAHVDFTYNFTDKWSAYADIEGFWLSTDWIFDSVLALQYQLNPQWGGDIGWRHYSRDIETDALANRTEYDALYLAVNYSF